MAMVGLAIILAAFGLPGETPVAAAVIDGASAQDWRPMTTWVAQDEPEQYGVADQGGSLEFTASGAGKQMVWLLDLREYDVSGDERYVLVRYKAEGLVAASSNYFIHGQEGSVGGRTYAEAGSVRSDGQWHMLAIDLMRLEPAGPTYGLAVKVIVGEAGEGKLTIARIEFADELRPGVEMADTPPRPKAKTVTLEWASLTGLRAEPGWTATPATVSNFEVQGTAERFTVSGKDKGMRWRLAPPEPVDLKQTPWMSFRYMVTGLPARTAYVIWLGEDASGSKGERTIACFAKDLAVDGVWHEFTTKLESTFTVTQLAVGLDSESQETTLTLGPVSFSARPVRRPMAEVLGHQRRTGPWPQGKDGFETVTLEVRGGKPSGFLAQRLGVDDWFTAPQIAVDGVPFVVETDPTQVSQTSTSGLDELGIRLPPDASEVYLLTANTAPPTEPWGIDWRRPRPVAWLDVPEKTYCEIRYEQGPPDQMLLLDAEAAKWGMRRGLGVGVVHPDQSRRPVELVLHDRMQTAAFAVLGVTAHRGQVRVAEPTWDHLHHGRLPGPPLADLALDGEGPAGAIRSGALQAEFGTEDGLTWERLEIVGLPGALACDPAPLFEVKVGDKTLEAKSWDVESASPVAGGMAYRLRNAGAELAAKVECVEGGDGELLLRLALANESSEMQTVDIMFPVVSGLRMGAAEDTWYLAGKRGGIINVAPISLREPLGERHPLQMDGFFSPKTGLALACLTHDTKAQHHFINIAKNERGGNWSCEYVRRDIDSGESFEVTEAALVLREGDWRAILGAYTDWLKTWFRPPTPRKKWLEKGFALLSANTHYNYSDDPKRRGAIQPLIDTMMQYIGICDWMHLFGWAASREYGDWGDYDHYDETVGGLDYFRSNISRAQEQGIAVSVYLDGYLSSAKGELVGKNAEAWAMQRADGKPDYVPTYDAYNQCPYVAGWRHHLAETYARVQREIGTKIMYIDEFGATDGRWKCYSRDHGHNGFQIPYAGEVAAMREIREAVGPDVALYVEYPPAEVARQYLDGSITYQALWSEPYESLAPHFIDLPRFAFPFFKQFHIIHYVPTRAGNWWLWKFPFFNGEVYRCGEPNLPGMDGPSLEFLRHAIEVQCAHREAFSSDDVSPLVPTEVPGVFANLFATPRERVWTLYNANGRSVRGTVLRVKHVAGATYEDGWRGEELVPEVTGNEAAIELHLGPKAVGCVVQVMP